MAMSWHQARATALDISVDMLRGLVGDAYIAAVIGVPAEVILAYGTDLCRHPEIAAVKAQILLLATELERERESWKRIEVENRAEQR